LPAARGDVIVANISNSNTVAAGKNIALNLGAPTPDDRQVGDRCGPDRAGR